MEKNKNTIKLFIGRQVESYLCLTDKDIHEFDSQSIDHIRTELVLHRYDKEEMSKILLEYKRILKKGATIIISVPDFFLISDKYSRSKIKIEDVNRLLLPAKVHYDFISIQKLLISKGFYAVKRLDAEKINVDSKCFHNGENISLTIEAYA